VFSIKEGPKIYKHLIGPTKLKNDFHYLSLFHYMTETRDQSIFMPALSKSSLMYNLVNG